MFTLHPSHLNSQPTLAHQEATRGVLRPAGGWQPWFRLPPEYKGITNVRASLGAMRKILGLTLGLLLLGLGSGCSTSTESPTQDEVLPVGAPTPILSLSDEERQDQGRPSLPTSRGTHQITFDDRHQLLVPVPGDWQASQLGPVGEGRRFVDQTGTVSLEIESRAWEGEAMALLRDADAGDESSLKGFRKVFAYREKGLPPPLDSADSAVRSYTYNAKAVSLQVKELVLVSAGRSPTAVIVRLVCRAEDFALMQTVWDDVHTGITLKATSS